MGAITCGSMDEYPPLQPDLLIYTPAAPTLARRLGGAAKAIKRQLR